MAELDALIHQPLRLKIMASLNAWPAGAGLEFSRLKKLTGATDGNLGAHIETLSKAGYVGVDKAFVGKKPQTPAAPPPGGAGPLRPPRRNPAGDHRGRGRALVSAVIPGRSQASEPGIPSLGTL